MNQRLRFGLLLCIVAVMLWAAPLSLMAAEGLTIGVSDISGAPGETVTVPIVLTDNPGVISIGISVSYDRDKLELLDAKNAGLLKDATFSEKISADPYVLMWNDALNNDMKDNGTLAVLTFRIKSSCPEGSAAIRLSAEKGNIHNYDLEDVPFTLKNGTVFVVKNHTHSWQPVSYQWSEDHSTCTAQRVCGDASCGALESETAVASVSVDKDGNRVYTVTFYHAGFAPQIKTVKTEKIAVTFRLIGTTRASEGVNYGTEPGNAYGSRYETWVATAAYRVEKGASVYDLFQKAMADAGLAYVGNGSYLRSVTAPSLCGGYALAEKDNGAYSGWMYTVNGKHPSLTMGQYALVDGDEVVIHYVNDYRYEENEYPWLEAEDVVGPIEPDIPDVPVTPDVPDIPDTPVFFLDVKEGDWFYDAVQYVAKRGLMEGIGGQLFAPAMDTTRGQLVTILYRLEGAPSISGIKNPFTDLTQDWYKNAVIWAADKGIVKGITATLYAPEQNITREQAAAILYRYAQYKGYDVAGRTDLRIFSDYRSVSDYALSAMSWAVSSGLMKGNLIHESILLDPAGSATRSQLASLLQRFCESIAK